MIDPEKYYDNKEKYLGSFKIDMAQFIVTLFECDKGEAYNIFKDRISLQSPFEDVAYIEIMSNFDCIKSHSDILINLDRAYNIARRLDDVSVIHFHNLIKMFYSYETNDWHFEDVQYVDMESHELKERLQWTSKSLETTIEWTELANKISLEIEKEFDNAYKRVSTLLKEKISNQDLLLFFDLDSIEEDDEDYCLIDKVKTLLS